MLVNECIIYAALALWLVIVHNACCVFMCGGGARSHTCDGCVQKVWSLNGCQCAKLHHHQHTQIKPMHSRPTHSVRPPNVHTHTHTHRCLFSSDQSFPLAGAFGYSVYKYQQKRVKENPEGPHFGGNPMIGALITTCMNIALACAVRAGGGGGGSRSRAGEIGNGRMRDLGMGV